MAGQRLTDKTALEQQTASGDLFYVVDVNDTTGSAAGTSKKIDSKLKFVCRLKKSQGLQQHFPLHATMQRRRRSARRTTVPCLKAAHVGNKS